jgi:hypothetical protein
MKTRALLIVITAVLFFLSGCGGGSQNQKDRQSVNDQQKQYSLGQPVPRYDFSLERDLLIKLYNLRNDRVATHSVWRSDFGMIEDDCPSMGFGIPYDTSLTNPWASYWNSGGSSVAVGQAEPNGIFASTNTAATWVMCVGSSGLIEPHYVETKVTVYPYAVSVDYDEDRVTRAGESSVNLGE